MNEEVEAVFTQLALMQAGGERLVLNEEDFATYTKYLESQCRVSSATTIALGCDSSAVVSPTSVMQAKISAWYQRPTTSFRGERVYSRSELTMWTQAYATRK